MNLPSVRSLNGDGPRCDICGERSKLRVVASGNLNDRGTYLCAFCVLEAVSLVLSANQEKAASE